MTLNDILVSALAQLDRGHDSQTLDTWRNKLTRFANEAVYDIAMAVRPYRTDTLTVTEGMADLSQLPRGCVKVCSVMQQGASRVFYRGVGSDVLRVPGAEGTVSVTYQYVPREMSLPTDEPELPAHCQGPIVTYVVGRERASGDVSTQGGAGVYFEIYNAAKRQLRTHRGERDVYCIRNRW